MSLLDPPVIARESFGAKLRRLARRAEVSNPVINAPWTIPAAWAPSTAYIIGDVVSNGGGWYVCIIAGTSAGSGGPTSTTTGSGITDNTATWTYIGGPTAAASDAYAPAYSTSTSTPSGLANHFAPTTLGSVFKVIGYTSVYATSYWSILTFASKAATVTGVGAAIEFETDAPKFAIGWTNGSPAVSVIIDGRRYSVTRQTPATGATPNWQIYDFGSTTARRRRNVRIEIMGTAAFAGVRVGPYDQVWRPSEQDDVRAICISDSILAGSSYGPFVGGGYVHQRLGHLLGWNDVRNFSTGGTGYINQGPSTSYTYGQRVAEALTYDPDLWVFFGSTNDIGQTAGNITAAALAAFQAIRSGGSRAPIIVFGVWPLNNAGVPTVEGAVEDAVDQFADGKTYFIPLYGDAVLPWVTGGWNNSANTSSSNATLYISGDSAHPADIGSAYLAERMARAIRDDVLPHIA